MRTNSRLESRIALLIGFAGGAFLAAVGLGLVPKWIPIGMAVCFLGIIAVVAFKDAR